MLLLLLLLYYCAGTYSSSRPINIELLSLLGHSSFCFPFCWLFKELDLIFVKISQVKKKIQILQCTSYPKQDCVKRRNFLLHFVLVVEPVVVGVVIRLVEDHHLVVLNLKNGPGRAEVTPITTGIVRTCMMYSVGPVVMCPVQSWVSEPATLPPLHSWGKNSIFNIFLLQLYFLFAVALVGPLCNCVFF